MPEGASLDSMDDVEVARYGVRTFQANTYRNELYPLTRIGRKNPWRGGFCEAQHLTTVRGRVLDHHKEIPVKGCTCGVYGCLSLDMLYGQYANNTAQVVTVIAAEGKTIIGPLGFRTAAARVVAWWSPVGYIQKMARKQFTDAKEYVDLDWMMTDYGLPKRNVQLKTPEVAQRRSIAWLRFWLWFCVTVTLDDIWDVWKFVHHHYAIIWIVIEVGLTLWMAACTRFYWVQYKMCRNTS